MISKTKYPIDESGVKKLFEAAGIGEVTDVKPLGAGEYNAVYAATGRDGKQYAVKIAPAPDCEVLPYEKGMMASEVFWYKTMREKTPIRVPEIYYSDFSRKVINTDWFVMEKLDGEHPNQMALTDAEKKEIEADIDKMTAEMHKVKNDKFGYIQNELYDTWYECIRAQTEIMLGCCKAKGHRSPRGKRLLSYIDENKALLEKVECCMVNYDIWAPNLIAKRVDGKIQLWWIDPERSFWGDRMCDFVCLDMFHSFRDKTDAIAAYNSVADKPVENNRENEIRYGVMMAYMGLLQETEKYYRYTPFHFGWWRNVIACAFFDYKIGFEILGRK